jgi:hypothetical protein
MKTYTEAKMRKIKKAILNIPSNHSGMFMCS